MPKLWKTTDPRIQAIRTAGRELNQALSRLRWIQDDEERSLTAGWQDELAVVIRVLGRTKKSLEQLARTPDEGMDESVDRPTARPAGDRQRP